MSSRNLYNRIAAKVAPTAVGTKIATPNGIELLDKRFDKCLIVCQNAVLEVALALRLRAHPGTGQVRRSEIRLHAVNLGDWKGKWS